MAKRARKQKHWWSDEAWFSPRFRNKIKDVDNLLISLQEAEGRPLEYEDVTCVLMAPEPERLVGEWVRFLNKQKRSPHPQRLVRIG